MKLVSFHLISVIWLHRKDGYQMERMIRLHSSHTLSVMVCLNSVANNCFSFCIVFSFLYAYVEYEKKPLSFNWIEFRLNRFSNGARLTRSLTLLWNHRTTPQTIGIGINRVFYSETVKKIIEIYDRYNKRIHVFDRSFINVSIAMSFYAWFFPVYLHNVLPTASYRCVLRW